MFISEKFLKYLTPIILLTIFCISVLMYWPVIIKPVPPGVDAAVYLNDVRWILNNHKLLKSNQPTYHGSSAYPAPLTDLNIVLLHLATNLDLVAPLFTLYQILLILLLLASSYLVGQIYSKTMSFLLPVAILGSFSIIRLFVGSTISNLLAFVYMNMIFVFICSFIKTKRVGSLFGIFFFSSGLYLTHNYLSAPIFIPTLVVYLLFLLIVDKKFRSATRSLFIGLRPYLKVALFIGFLFLMFVVVKAYLPIIKEARHAFLNTTIFTVFRKPIHLNELGPYFGTFSYGIAIIGLAAYLVKKSNFLTHKSLWIFWIVVLLSLLQLYRIGVNFFYERLVFLGAIAISLFASYAVDSLRESAHKQFYKYGVIVTLFITTLIVTGTNQINTLYLNSNKINADQIEGLTILRKVSTIQDVVYSQVNGVSETYHDMMVSDRDIVYFPTIQRNCIKGSLACEAFTTPKDFQSKNFFHKNNIKFFLFLKPNMEGNVYLDRLVAQYQSDPAYSMLFQKASISVFYLNN